MPLCEEEADDFVPVRTVAVDSFPQTVHVEAGRDKTAVTLTMIHGGGTRNKWEQNPAMLVPTK